MPTRICTDEKRTKQLLFRYNFCTFASIKGTSINSPFCKNFNNCWIPEHFCALFVFGLHLSDFHSITMPPHCAFVQAKHLLFQNSKITTKQFIEIPFVFSMQFWCQSSVKRVWKCIKFVKFFCGFGEFYLKIWRFENLKITAVLIPKTRN